jgi:hypothetical protein
LISKKALKKAFFISLLFLVDSYLLLKPTPERALRTLCVGFFVVAKSSDDYYPITHHAAATGTAN